MRDKASALRQRKIGTAGKDPYPGKPERTFGIIGRT